MKNFVFTTLFVAFFVLPPVACAGPGDSSVSKNFIPPDPTKSWSGEKKTYRRMKNSSGTDIMVSVQRAPARKDAKCGSGGWKYSVAWRTRVETHPDGQIKAHVHPGEVCYGDVPCPSTGRAAVYLRKLIDEPIPDFPENAGKDWTSKWKGFCD